MTSFTMTRARAVLAGAAVLGLGAAGTLAAWSDSEFAFGVFSAKADFKVEGSTSASGPFSSHNAAGNAAALTFSAPADNLSASQPVSATYWLRVTGDSAGSVTVGAPTLESANLVDRIDVSIDQRECGGAGAELVSGRLSELTALADAFTLPAGVDGQPGAAVPVCITATLADTTGLEPGNTFSTGPVTWAFTVNESEV